MKMNAENTTVVNVRMPQQIKHDAQQILSELGLSTSDAVRLFFRQIVDEGGLPFQPRLSAETLQAMADTEAGRLEEVTLDQLKAELDAIH